MVVGARTAQHSAYFVLDDLRRERVQATEHFLAVYDRTLGTGVIYRTDGRERVMPMPDGTYQTGGERYAPDALPFDALVPIESFHFAWHAFYPASETVRR